MRATRALSPIAALLLAACATTGSTLGSGIGERFTDTPPYRAGAVVEPEASFLRLPIAYQRGATDSPNFDPSGEGGSPMAALLAEMNAYADTLAGGRLGSSGIVAVQLAGTPPDVQFGCVPATIGGCADPDEESGPAVLASASEQPLMRLAVGRPSRNWIEALGPELDRAGASHALVITIELGQYWVTKSGWNDRKSLQLGTGHTVRLPWLTSLDTPVGVLQLTGGAIGRDGRAVRIGAEGMLAKRTGIVASGFGWQAVITDEDVNRLRTLRRDDLPGQPLVWQVALRELMADLTNRPAIAQQ